MDCAIGNLDSAAVDNRPRITAVELETTEIHLTLCTADNEEGHAQEEPDHLEPAPETAKSEVTREPVITPTHGVKNTNLIIEEAIDGFDFLFSEPRPKGRIQFAENQTIIFDDEGKVDELIVKCRDATSSPPLRPALKNRTEPIDVSYFEQNETSYLEEDGDDLGGHPCTDHTVEETWITIERLFTLHDIPLNEVRDHGNLLVALQRLAVGAAESFRKREQCYKFVGRQQSIEEIDELEYFNDNLKCDVEKLNKRLANESIKWEVVDQTIVANDELKAKVDELGATIKTLSTELESSPKWDDVDGLLEEDKELKSRIAELNNTIKDDASTYAKELQELQVVIDGLKGQNAKLLLNEVQLTVRISELTAQLTDTSTRLQIHDTTLKENEKLKCEIGKFKSTNSSLRKENADMNKRIRSMKKKVYNRFFVENVGLISTNEELTQKLEEILFTNKELSSTNTDLTSKNSQVFAEKCELLSTNGELVKRLEDGSARNKDLQKNCLTAKIECQNTKSDMEFVEKLYGSKMKELASQIRELQLLREQDSLKICLVTQINDNLLADKDVLSATLNEKLAENNQFKRQLKDNESLIANAQQWEAQVEICLSSLNRLQEENFKLLEKCTKSEVLSSKLQLENNELSSFKKDFTAFDEKYDWLESVALSLRQEKEHSDSEVKQLKRQLRASTKAVESLERTKSQNKRKPEELHNQLNDLQSKYNQLVKMFDVKERELQRALDNIQELEIAHYDITSLSRTRNPAAAGAAPDEANAQELAPSKRWKIKSPSSFRSKRRFFPRSVAS